MVAAASRSGYTHYMFRGIDRPGHRGCLERLGCSHNKLWRPVQEAHDLDSDVSGDHLWVALCMNVTALCRLQYLSGKSYSAHEATVVTSSALIQMLLLCIDKANLCVRGGTRPCLCVWVCGCVGGGRPPAPVMCQSSYDDQHDRVS